jgi:hypothetical protein
MPLYACPSCRATLPRAHPGSQVVCRGCGTPATLPGGAPFELPPPVISRTTPRQPEVRFRGLRIAVSFLRGLIWVALALSAAFVLWLNMVFYRAAAGISTSSGNDPSLPLAVIYANLLPHTCFLVIAFVLARSVDTAIGHVLGMIDPSSRAAG